MAARFHHLPPSREADFIAAWAERVPGRLMAERFEISIAQVYEARRRLKLVRRQGPPPRPRYRFKDVTTAELEAEMPRLCLTAAASVARRYAGPKPC